MTKKQLRERIKKDIIALAKLGVNNTADISKLFTKEDKINIDFSGQSNNGDITQYWHSNNGDVSQSWHSNEGDVFQTMHSNNGDVSQSWHSNKGTVRQQGHSNRCMVLQYGHSNEGNILQHGHSNDGDVSQREHSNKGDVYQSWHSNNGNVSQKEHLNKGYVHQYGHSNEGDEYNSDYAIINGKKYDAIRLDRVYSIIIEDKRRNGIGVFKDHEDRFVATNGIISYHSHASYITAKAGLKHKKKKLMEGVGKWVKTLDDDSKITREIFHEETGSCMPGINSWCEKVGISEETKEITFKEFKELAKTNPTMETKQVMSALEIIKESE